MRRRAPVPGARGAGGSEAARAGRGTGLRVGLVSLGCPKNLVDSEVMLGLLKRSGARLVTDARQADVVVVNTCGFIENARRESVETILEMAQLKEGHPGKRLVVAGCLVQRHAPELRREMPEIDALLGTGEIQHVVEAVVGARNGAKKAGPPEPTWLHNRETPRELSTPGHLAYLKIGDGCDYRCAFCIIPRLRGRYRSRALEDVVAEAERLVERGVRELVLVAQDTTRYGVDLGLRDGLARLLRRLGRIARLRWIRVMYAHPTTLSDALLETMAGEEKVVKYLDVPLQHASACGVPPVASASWASSSGFVGACPE
jgi:ribosomal protein S12 methylthiotransferase